MNRLATLATMPFLITYGVIEYSYFALCMQFDMNQKRIQNYKAQGLPSPTFNKANKEDAASVVSDDGTVSSVDSRGEAIPERKARGDEEFEQLLEKYNVDEIEEKPKNFYSHICNRWVSISGVSIVLKINVLTFT